MLRKQTYGNYPAVTNMMKAVYEGVQVPMDAALRIETRYFIKTLMTPQAQGMIRSPVPVQAGAGQGRRASGRRAEVRPEEGRRARRRHDGRGHRLCAGHGRHRDRADRPARKPPTRARPTPRTWSKKRVSRGQMTQEKADAVLALITPTTDYDLIKGSDLVVEAVFESREIKAEVTKKAEAQLAARRRVRLQHLDPADHRPGRGLACGPRTSSASTSSRRSTR